VEKIELVYSAAGFPKICRANRSQISPETE
jgi:hypothetical protein